MTNEESNRIIGMTLERLKAARKELVCWESKARFMAEDLETVASVLRGSVKGNCTSGYFIVEPEQGPKHIDWPSTQDMNDILMSRERLEQEIAELEKQAKKMGYDI